MLFYPEPITRLIDEFRSLPGIGPKSAQRLAFYVLSLDEERVKRYAETLIYAKEKIVSCSRCGNLTDIDPCAVCQDDTRSDDILCVVERPEDVLAMEKAREFKGKYHVLGGVISPMEGIGPNDINVRQLLMRVGESSVEEVVVATNSDVEGEATAIYIGKLLKPLGVKVTRLAHGLPVGGDLEYADEVTLARAFEGRREI